MSNQAKVGALVLAALGLAAYFVLRIENISVGKRVAASYIVELPDAQGLTEKSLVLYGGIRVGRVSKLTLTGGIVEALVDLKSDVPLTRGTRARVASVGLLGERQLELIPGPTDGERLPPDSRIPGATSKSLDDVISRLGTMGEDLNAVTATLHHTFGGAEGEQRLSTLVDNVGRLVVHLDQTVVGNRSDISETVKNLRDFSRALTQLTGATNGTGGSGLGEAAGSLSSIPGRIDSTLGHFDEVGRRLDEGGGTLGRLLHSDETGIRLDRALHSVERGADQVASTFGWVAHTRLGLGLRGEYLAQTQAPKGTLTMEVLPPAPAFFRFEAVAQGAGLAPAPPASVTFSTEAGWRGSIWALRAGMIQSTLGAGFDLLLLSDRLRLSVDAWDPARDTLRPHARLEGAFSIFPQVSVIAGWDDALNAGRGVDSVFLGAALRFQTGTPK